MYAVMPLIPAPVRLSFKCTPEEFAELIERPGVIPAPYMARAYWVALETIEALPRTDIKRLLNQSYGLVISKLSKKAQSWLGKPAKKAKSSSRPHL